MISRINSIQHIGLAVQNMDAALKYYRKFFGMDIPFFDSVQPAPLMDVYTHGNTITKRASMIMNLQGGCAMEVLTPTSFKPSKSSTPMQVGDLHIFMVHFKTRDLNKHHKFATSNGAIGVSEVKTNPAGTQVYDLKDEDGNWFRMEPTQDLYREMHHVSSGVAGCSIGVKNIDESLKLYRDIFGYDRVEFDQTGVFDDFKHLPGGDQQYRRIRLKQSMQTGGGFGHLVGDSFIELVQALDREPNRTFKGRIWGDSGFVHLGLDVKGMKELGSKLTAAGHPFRCDSNEALSMGQTKVHCTYIDDIDGTLIEMIEVYKVPIIERWGLFLNVEKRDPLKPLPAFMLKAMRFSRIKD
jgi:catechol 2,3-dioxygenase-like lactoylglutathione lyase family enzyme